MDQNFIGGKNMNEKRIYVTKPFLPPIDEYYTYLKRIWDSNILTNNGQLHQELEKGLTEYLKCENITLLVNGHLALETALKMLPIRGEIITTPFTFASTIHSIINTGSQPVFCDIKPDDCTIDEEKIEELITDETTAIVAVHVYGFPCNIEGIESIAKKHGLKVIYDAAHAFGVEYNGMPISNFGDVSMFSFHATKLFHSIEGGALIYKNIEYKGLFNLYKNFGISGPDNVDIVGTNAKMNEFQAAMGLANLKHIDYIIEKRGIITKRYTQNLKDIEGITIINTQRATKKNHAYYPILVDEQKYGHTRDELSSYLESNSIFVRKYFYPIATNYQCFNGRYINSNVPVSEYTSQRILTLPLYTDLLLDDVDRICNLINMFKEK